MCIRFKTFRYIVCLFIALTATVTLALSIILSRSILHRGFTWLLVVVELLSTIRSIWSVLRRPISGSCQPVASEAICLFTLFPLQLIIVFVISTFPLQHQRDSGVFFTMQAFAIASAAIRTPFCVFHPPRGR
ncbi:hypothetical protein BJ165DRAFT_1454845 [Panaeolus papilionaceus]|nr:hypothetical protein BJ165DRAFT_1454845 [Panaeolus papilionaceus]